MIQANLNSNRNNFVFNSIYLELIILISLSRIYLACHFPHQCMVGGLIGWLLARFVQENWYKLDVITKALNNQEQQKQQEQQDKFLGYFFISISFVVFSSALSTYLFLDLLGIDPNWTIKLATEYCIKREYLHMDTAPLSLMRPASYLALALACRRQCRIIFA